MNKKKIYVLNKCINKKQPVIRGSEWGGSTCRLKFSNFVGSRLIFSIFVGCRKISVNE